ncbi:molecular chaperone [Ewingella americana]|uniref:fimbrial biogenesis chaperone n=1 Tax=Ewingella americana TaxID=41202 RepID=UPI001639591E|nr:molecular chaperone [Ewingella americana]QMV51915.1 molecular chaperone [Ewingella americana]
MERWRAKIITVFLLFITTSVQAGIVIGGTRLIYEGNKKEASITITNPDKVPFLIQSWVDGELLSGQSKAEKAPFLATPPLFRLDAERQNVLRVVRAGGNLPEDRESIFWMNIKSIPYAEKRENTLQIAVKTRIKLIYRPAGIETMPEEAVKNLTWKRMGNSVLINNATAHYFTFFNVKINGAEIKDVPMVAPYSNVSFTLPSNITGNALTWQYINDYGGTSQSFVQTL